MSNSRTFLSEYQPHASVVIAATAPPGVERISVCLELESKSSDQREEKRDGYKRITKALDNNIAVWEAPLFEPCPEFDALTVAQRAIWDAR
jgi:hypothetical protein